MTGVTVNAAVPPATDSQLKYVALLVTSRVLPADIAAWLPANPTDSLSRRTASQLINALKDAPYKPTTGPAPGPQAPGPQAPGAAAKPAAPASVVDDGYYYHDGRVVKVQWNRAGTNKYAKVLTVEDDHASWVYTPGLLRQLTADEVLTREIAERMGVDPDSPLYGWCCICGRTLTDEESIERGIGPVCANKMGW